MEALMLQVRNWAEAGNYDAIIEVLPEVEDPGQYDEVVMCIADAYLVKGFYRKAEKWLRKIDKQGEMSGAWNYRLAVTLMHQMRLEEGLPYAEKAVCKDTGYPLGWLVYSKLLYGCGRAEEALRVAKCGLELMPGDEEFISLIENISDKLEFPDVTGIEEDAGDWENGENKAGTFCCSVLLNSLEFDVDKVLANLKAEWGIVFMGEEDVYNEDIMDVDKSTRFFYFKEAGVVISFIPTKVANGEAEYFAGTNYIWPEAIEVTETHKAHVLVAVLTYGLTPIEGGKLYVKVVASCLRQLNTIGVYTSGTVFQPEDYIEEANLMKKNGYILPLWNLVHFGLYQDDVGCNAYTCGMNAFGKEEMEILGSKYDLFELREFMFKIAHYVIGLDVTLQEGETVVHDGGQKLLITRSEGVAVEGMTLKIAY